MNPGQYKTSYDSAINLLKMVGLAKIVQNGNKPSSIQFDNTRKERDYRVVYEVAINNNDYNVLLMDYSIFQFRYEAGPNGLDIGYAYYEYPLDFPSYDFYIQENGFEYEDVGEELRDIYEQELQAAPVKRSPTPVRYDYDLLRYKAGVHPVSHIHLGHSNNVRLPANRIISPKLFVFFVLKHVYYPLWKDLINKDTVVDEYEKARQCCDELDEDKFCELDKIELFLS